MNRPLYDTKEGMQPTDFPFHPLQGDQLEANLSDFARQLRPLGRILELPEYNVWGCSPVHGPDGRIHVFYSRWLNAYGHYGWVATCEIAHAVADKPEGPYTDLGPVLQGRGGTAWDSWSIHNPSVHRVDGRYVLLYMGSDGSTLGIRQEDIIPMDMDTYRPYFRSLVATKRVGMAVADNLDGPWTRVSDSAPMIPAGEPGEWDDLVTSNPAFLKDPVGEYRIYYKGWDLKSDQAGASNRKYGLATAASLAGPYRKHPDNPVIDFSRHDPNCQCEDAYFWTVDGGFRVILRDMGYFNHEYGLYMESADGIRWSKPRIAFLEADAYLHEPHTGLDREGRFERPQLLMGPDGPTHLFTALRGGRYGTSSGFVLSLS